MVLALLLVTAATPSLRDRLVGTWRTTDDTAFSITYRKNGTGESTAGKFRWVLEEVNKVTVTYDEGSGQLSWIEFKGDELIETDIVDTDITRYRRVKPAR